MGDDGGGSPVATLLAAADSDTRCGVVAEGLRESGQQHLLAKTLDHPMRWAAFGSRAAPVQPVAGSPGSRSGLSFEEGEGGASGGSGCQVCARSLRLKATKSRSKCSNCCLLSAFCCRNRFVSRREDEISESILEISAACLARSSLQLGTSDSRRWLQRSDGIRRVDQEGAHKAGRGIR